MLEDCWLAVDVDWRTVDAESVGLGYSSIEDTDTAEIRRARDLLSLWRPVQDKRQRGCHAIEHVTHASGVQAPPLRPMTVQAVAGRIA